MWFRAFILVFVSALCVAPTHGDDSTVKKLVGDFYHQIKRPKHNAIAKSTAQKIIELGRLKKDKTLRARGILRLAYVNFAADKETDWKSSFASCEQLTPPESLARAEFLLFRGIVKIRCKDIRHGLRDLEDSIWISQQNRNDDLLSYAHAFYAEHLLRSGSVDRALHHGFQGLTIAEHINNPTAEYYCVAALMRTFTAANQKEDAVEYALRLRELDPESVQADWILIDSEDAEVIASIEPRIEKAVSGDSTGKDKFELASNQLALAQIRKTQKRTSEAKELFDLASENYHAYGSSKNADLAHYQKTLMLYENNDSDTSMKDLFRAANRRAPPIVARQVAEDMSKTLGAQGRFREAYHWGRRHIKTNRNQTSRQIADAKKAASSSWASELRSRDQQEKILTQQNEAWKSLLFNCGLTSLGVGIGFLGLIRFRRLKRSSSKLEHLVDARTRSLRLAQEEAQMADMAKSEFLARVNHELRNPLTAILGYCELLEMSPDTQETKDQYLDGLRTSSQHLLDLVGEVLDVAKIADGQIAIQQKTLIFTKPVMTSMAFSANKPRKKA